MNQEVIYGYVNEDNVLIGTAWVVKDDLDTVERIKNEEYQAAAAYLIEDPNEPLHINVSIWDGTHFVLPESEMLDSSSN